MRDILLDLRWAFRVLVRNPASSFFAIASLAIGVGATGAVYGTVDWLLNRPPAGVIEPHRLVTLQAADREDPDARQGFSFPQYRALLQVQDAFTDLAAYGKTIAVAGDGERSADQITLEFVSGQYFSLLGVRPALGRVLAPDDAVDGAPPAAMLSYRFWQSRFGGDPRVVDSSIHVNGRRTLVVGVAPRDFEGFNLDWNGPTAVWVPMQATKPFAAFLPPTSGSPLLLTIGRLRPEMTLELAREKAQAWIEGLPRPASSSFKFTAISAMPSTETRIGRREEARTFLSVLLVVCGLMLLAACSNVANFLVGRAVTRRREIAMRVALGATRGRILRLLISEAAVIAVFASLLGAVAAVLFGEVLATWPRAYLNLPMTSRSFSTDAAIDFRMVGLSVLLGLATLLLFGLLPAVIASFRDPAGDLKSRRPGWSWTGVRVTTRQVVLVLQVGLAVALSIAAGLLLRSFGRIVSVDSGHARPESVLLARVVPTGLTAEQGHLFYEQLLARLNGAPGVTSATIGWNLPFMVGQTILSVPGRDMEPVQLPTTAAGPKYFETQGVAMLAGREFTADERDVSAGVVVNRELAARLWPNGDAVGQALAYGPRREATQVVGVVDSRCFYLLGDPGPCVWRAFPRGTSSGYLRIRVSGRPIDFVPTLRQIVAELNPAVAVAEEIALDAFLRESTARERTAALASGTLALLGIVLLASGCVSLFVSMVRESVREIAIRMALGASHRRLTRRIALHGFGLTLVGVGLGVIAAIALGKRLADELYKTNPGDPLVFVAAPALVVLLALVAVTYSARVATRTDPVANLKVE